MVVIVIKLCLYFRSIS